MPGFCPTAANQELGIASSWHCREMEVALRYKLFAQFTLFTLLALLTMLTLISLFSLLTLLPQLTLFTLLSRCFYCLNTAYTMAYMP